MSAEEWRPIPGYPGYEASDQGRIRSLKSWRGEAGPRIRKQCVSHGYYQTSVHVDGRTQRLMVHFLVSLAFYGPRPTDHPEVRHLNGNALDNRAANLRYGTRAENYADLFTHGTHPMASRTHCKHGHEYTEENTRWEPNKSSRRRRCLACVRNKINADRERRQAARTASAA